MLETKSSDAVNQSAKCALLIELSEMTLNFRKLYDQFNLPICAVDCGKLCSPHNPSALPFCCDICKAVPVAYHAEKKYLESKTKLWQSWRGDECAQDPSDPAMLQEQTPEHLCLIACRGVQFCQRDFRAISCRQFPFFPYITSDDRFIGLTYNWDFEQLCWVISHLDQVTPTYRLEFIHTYDQLLFDVPGEYESYYDLSEDMRVHFAKLRRRIPILHRNGSDYLLSPKSEKLEKVNPSRFRTFGPYQKD